MIEQCAILLGGLGTRLGALTQEMPKPLLHVGGEPFVDVLVGEAVRRGFRDILLLAGYKAGVVEAYVEGLAGRLPAGCSVSVSIEREPLGTGGALGWAGDLLADRFLLLNGDTWFDFNWLDLAVVAGDGAAVAVRDVPLADRYESLRLGPAGQVEAIVERGGAEGPVSINGGVYCLRKSDLVGFPERFSIESDLLPRLIDASLLKARAYDGFFLDIGVPEAFAAAQIDIPAQRTRPAVFFDRDGVLNHDDNYVGSADRFHWIPGAQQAVKLANDLGYYVFVVTNQAGVARGFYGEDDVRALHHWIARDLRQSGAAIDDWRYCPFHPDGKVEAYRGSHPWRKPAPGMLLDLIDSWPVRRDGSILFGDQQSDLDAAAAAGIEGVRFEGGDLHACVERYLVPQFRIAPSIDLPGNASL
jgi:D-glycero-D-manno-heptose 1,7-bisphosphate phosphatase